ncbi:TonB-dependent receptor [Sphingomonas sp. SFZ2018-12]|uniref:TonB-dependent receptor n=1 Tax=Sphingomonas sp. SFZ2018-12 TaxID=2683197 RepID=UPI001F0F51DE|nr:TonB-dependent receptor [Sphingomonas sp. SFZ2018-12]MCH4895052.1 TonB-dependent receptor [Sphingomonas sp. SFZ2018-12]
MSGPRLTRWRLILLGSVALTVAASPAGAQTAQAPAPEAQENEDADGGEDAILVLGTRRSLEDALLTKRASTQIVDSISSEGIGRLPDLNLAESLQRVPGVQINRSANRRQGTVSIRGLPGDFSQTLINGQYLASPDVSNFSYGTVRSEVFSGIDVIKAQGADQITGGLSGLINLRTGSAFDARDGIAINADATYEELSEKFAPGGAITAAYEIVPGTFAVRGAFGYKSSKFRIDNFQVNTYDRIAGAATADNGDDVFRPREVRLPNQYVETDSLSGSFGAEWRPVDGIKAELFGFYNDFRSDADQNEFLVSVQPASVVSALRGAEPSGDFGSTIAAVRIANPQINVDTRLLTEIFRTGAITGKLGWSNDDWSITGTAHYTRATRDLRTQGYQAIQRSLGGAGNGFSVDIDSGSGRLGDAVFRLTPGAGQLVNLQQAFGAPIAPTFREIRAVNTPGASFLGGFRNQEESEDELSFSLDVVKAFDNGPLDAIRIGGTYREKTQDQSQSLAGLFGANVSALTNGFYNYSLFEGGQPYLNGRANGIDLSGYGQLDVRAITAAITPVSGSPAGAAYFIGPEGLVNFIDSTALSLIYDNSQKIYGGYAMLDIDQELAADVRVRGNVGVRYEKSERATTAQNQPQVFALTYDNLLPSANLIFEFGSNLVLRTSYTETLRRPQVDSFAVLRSIAVDGTGQIVTIGLGAADLQPFTSENLDISLEWYNRPGSSVSLLGFRKKVSDFAGTTRLCPADGGGFGFGPLTQASGVCRTVNAVPAQGSFPAVLQGATVNINVTANQDSFVLSGFEVSVQQNLDFLPAPWNGFGGQVNYTNVDFETDSSFRLGEISKHTVNAVIYYEIKQFGIRAAYNYRSGYFLASAGTQTGADRSVRARDQLDISATLNLTDRLSLTAEAFNVTNSQLIEFEGAANRVRNYFEYGRTYTFGARYRL